MKLWIWSDLHLELQAPTLPDRAPEAERANGFLWDLVIDTEDLP